MKKYLVIPLLFLYLLSVSGIVYYAHYCGSSLVSIGVYTESAGCEDSGCGDESEEPDDCCKDEVVTAKVVQDQNSNEIYKLKLSSLHVVLPLPQYDSYYADISVHHIAKVHHANAPPGLWQSLPLYKLHSRFTYYG
ncbi:MAG: hypothetical protein JNL72_06185 [Flavipsychrobacter sp.]|nr:hypothetical protein [Flavipsychrobacter sp.]